jgi:hypothetical protein
MHFIMNTNSIKSAMRVSLASQLGNYKFTCKRHNNLDATGMKPHNYSLIVQVLSAKHFICEQRKSSAISDHN